MKYNILQAVRALRGRLLFLSEAGLLSSAWQRRAHPRTSPSIWHITLLGGQGRHWRSSGPL